jgi:cytochrome c5
MVEYAPPGTRPSTGRGSRQPHGPRCARAGHSKDVTVTQQQDQKFFDLFSIIVGSLVVFSFTLFLVARVTAANTQRQWVQQDAEYQLGVDARLAPIGRVRLPGDEPAQANTGQVALAETVAAPLSGPQVYNEACIACHGSGIGGAPRLGDVDAWAPRIARGREVLDDHVINGYTGDVGYMPPKGGRVDLSDEEILAALSYLLAESR